MSNDASWKVEMPPATLTALNESIAHWERMASGERLEDEEHSVINCALCGLFYKLGCVGCPVADAGHSECGKNSKGEKSPWQKADDACWNHAFRGVEPYDTDAFKDAAFDMVEFLKGLRPIEVKTDTATQL